jgi:hypothetical protein
VRAAPSVERPEPAQRPRRPPGDGARRWLHRTVRTRPLAVAALLVGLHVLLALLSFEPRPHTGGDNAAYISLARSLLERASYLELWDPAEPPHTKYPPVFPAVLALALAAGLQPFVQLKLVVIAFSAVAVGFSFLWLRARRRPLIALGIGLLLAIAPGVLREGRWILSDVPFWCFTIIALWAFEKLQRDDWRRFAVAAAAVLLAYFTRSAGLPLVLAALLWLAWRAHWRQLAALAALMVVPAALWWLRARAFGPAGYASEFWLINPYMPDAGTIGAADAVDRVLANLGKYTGIHLPSLLGGGPSPLLHFIGVSAFLLAVPGWLLRLRRGRVADLFLPAYLGLILLWPAVWSGERFLLPVLPLLLFYAAAGLLWTVRRVSARYDCAVGTAAVLLVLLMATPALAESVRAGRACTALYRAGVAFPCLPGPYWHDFFQVAVWMGEALDDDAVVLTRKPRLFYVLSGLRGANYPLSGESDQFAAAVGRTGARYVVFDRLDSVSELYLRPVLTRRPDAFCVAHVRETSGTVVFGIIGERLHAPAPNAEPGATDGEGVAFALCDGGFTDDRR